jgi:hypothetical protein
MARLDGKNIIIPPSGVDVLPQTSKHPKKRFPLLSSNVTAAHLAYGEDCDTPRYAMETRQGRGSDEQGPLPH